MRISHKRKVKLKLQKKTQAFAISLESVAPAKTSMTETLKSVSTADVGKTEKVAKVATAKINSAVTLTPKQQQVFDIVVNNSGGLNPKGIGLEAGIEEVKAASWATSALKKLVEEGLVERMKLAGNKVLYKAI
jgi:hypothetical protein